MTIYKWVQSRPDDMFAPAYLLFISGKSYEIKMDGRWQREPIWDDDERLVSASALWEQVYP